MHHFNGVTSPQTAPPLPQMLARLGPPGVALLSAPSASCNLGCPICRSVGVVTLRRRTLSYVSATRSRRQNPTNAFQIEHKNLASPAGQREGCAGDIGVTYASRSQRAAARARSIFSRSRCLFPPPPRHPKPHYRRTPARFRCARANIRQHPPTQKPRKTAIPATIRAATARSAALSTTSAPNPLSVRPRSAPAGRRASR